MVVGLLPREIGRRVDPYDAYPAQFAATFDADAIARARPAPGARVPAAADRRAPAAAGSQVDPTRARRHRRPCSAVGDRRCGSAVLLADRLRRGGRPARGRRRSGDGDPARAAVGLRHARLVGVLIVAAFLVNRNIFNSDNYRYLVFLLTPWSLGFGLGLHDLSRRGSAGGWRPG